MITVRPYINRILSLYRRIRHRLGRCCIFLKGYFFGDFFGPSLSVTLIAMAAILSAMLIFIDFGKGQDRLLDFLAYMLPIIAGVVAGITALEKKEGSLFYVLSCLVLICGLFFYFLSKNLLLIGGASFISVMALWPASIAMVDKWLERDNNQWTAFLLPGFYGVISILVSVSAFIGTALHYRI